MHGIDSIILQKLNGFQFHTISFKTQDFTHWQITYLSTMYLSTNTYVVYHVVGTKVRSTYSNECIGISLSTCCIDSSYLISGIT